jgi:hypothetical protein
LCEKSLKVFKKGMLSLDWVWTKSGLRGGGLRKRLIAASGKRPGAKQAAEKGLIAAFGKRPGAKAR